MAYGMAEAPIAKYLVLKSRNASLGLNFPFHPLEAILNPLKQHRAIELYLHNAPVVGG